MNAQHADPPDSGSDSEVRRRFLSLATGRDVAALLDVPYARLVYHLYKSGPDRYTQFSIPKASGGCRTISAPRPGLKVIQRKLANVLQAVYEPRECVQGFVVKKGIVSNASKHARKRWVFNVDLADFFPSVNFGRVRGMFMAKPYRLPAEAATVLAQICSHENQLPQGAPTSPIVSNMICARMDSELQRLAAGHKCTFTRYADDLTLSTALPDFPLALAVRAEGGVQLGDELAGTIERNGFGINERKVRLRRYDQRQEVTGLTANRIPNVRRRYLGQIRAMLHAWNKYSLEGAQQDFVTRYCRKHRYPDRWDPSFVRVVKGKLDFLRMVRGPDFKPYKKLLGQYEKVSQGATVEDEEPVPVSTVPIIWTEGKSDWRHLKAAWVVLRASGRFGEMDLEFEEYDYDMGDAKLRKKCVHWCRTRQARPTVFLFDSDNHSIVEEMANPDTGYRYWGNSVFSLALPVPPHRAGMSGVSIEFYYTGEEIKREDANGRRLFISTEFDPVSSVHLGGSLVYTDRSKPLRGDRDAFIISDSVFDASDRQRGDIALPKADFADYVLEGVPLFHDFDFAAFAPVFEMIARIIEAARGETNGKQ